MKLRYNARSSSQARPSRFNGFDSIEAFIGGKTVVMPNGCWAFNGDLTKYGGVRRAKGEPSMPIHRLIFELVYGPIHEGKHVHHRCGNPGCIRPQHLKSVTPAEHAAIHAEWRRAGKAA